MLELADIFDALLILYTARRNFICEAGALTKCRQFLSRILLIAFTHMAEKGTFNANVLFFDSKICGAMMGLKKNNPYLADWTRS